MTMRVSAAEAEDVLLPVRAVCDGLVPLDVQWADDVLGSGCHVFVEDAVRGYVELTFRWGSRLLVGVTVITEPSAAVPVPPGLGDLPVRRGRARLESWPWAEGDDPWPPMPPENRRRVTVEGMWWVEADGMVAVGWGDAPTSWLDDGGGVRVGVVGDVLVAVMATQVSYEEPLGYPVNGP